MEEPKIYILLPDGSFSLMVGCQFLVINGKIDEKENQEIASGYIEQLVSSVWYGELEGEVINMCEFWKLRNIVKKMLHNGLDSLESLDNRLKLFDSLTSLGIAWS